MKKTKKFLSIFAILFVAIFALSCCFFAACGSKDDDNDKTTDGTTQDDGTTGGDDGGESESTGGDDGNENQGENDDGKKEEATVVSVTVSPTTLDLVVGEQETLTAAVTMSDETDYKGSYTWESSDEDIATVTGNGATATVTAVAEGSTTITVTVDGDECATCGVTVTEVDPYTEVENENELDAALSESSYIRITNDITVTSTVEIGDEVTIDLNGKSIQTEDLSSEQLENAYNTVAIGENGYLTVVDNSENDDGSIENSYTGCASNNYVAAIATTGTLKIEGGTIESSSIGVLAEGGTVTISGGSVESTYFSIFEGAGNVEVTIEGGTISGEKKGIAVCGDSAFGYWDGTTKQYQDDAKTTLNVSGGKITCQDDSPICSLGEANYTSAVINITGGEICRDDTLKTEGGNTTGTPMPAIYAPSTSLSISGGKITGPTAVEIRGGHATISGGTLVSNAEGEASDNANANDGAKTYGYSIAIYPYGGVSRSGAHINETNTEAQTTNNEVIVSVTGGTFEGGIYKAENAERTNWNYTNTYSFSITGGTFSEDPSSYVNLAGCNVSNENGYYVVEKQGVDSEMISISDLVSAGTLHEAKHDASPSTAYTAGQDLYSGTDGTKVSFTASTGDNEYVDLDSNSKSIDNYSFTYRLKLSGSGSATYRSLKIEAVGACTVTVYMMSSSGNKTATESDTGEATYGNRNVYLYDSTYTTELNGYTFDGSTDSTGVSGQQIGKYTFEISEAGTYYIGSAESGINIYGILITYA